jgi:hypothetical protein
MLEKLLQNLNLDPTTALILAAGVIWLLARNSTQIVSVARKWLPKRSTILLPSPQTSGIDCARAFQVLRDHIKAVDPQRIDAFDEFASTVFKTTERHTHE